MPPRTMLWPLDPHTIGKHMVLRSYMEAWLPIILSRFERAMFVDAFAGPGEYRSGEPGSPVIALNALAEHTSQDMMTGQIDYVFIEERSDRFSHLEEVIERQRMEGSIPPICRISIFNSTFASAMPKLIDSIGMDHIPTFVMIDPFGVSGIGMKYIEALMDCPSTEVYISFMYDFMNRFRDHPNFERHLDDLFGCPDWIRGIDMPDDKARKEFFYGLYTKQLKVSGAQHVLHFDLYEGNRLVYALFFATKSDLGCGKMKRAMWKVDPLDGFRFTGGMDRQLMLGPEMVDRSLLKDDLINEFGLNQWLSIENVAQSMRSDKTGFHTSDYKEVLADMESEGAIEVREETRKRRLTFPDGTCLRFVEPPPPLPTQSTFDLWT